MTRYVFVVESTISLATVVEAESLSAAVAEAKRRAPFSVPEDKAVGNQNVEWATALDCDPGQGDLVDFHEGDGESFDDAIGLWEVENGK
jgi:hypothetical protein